MDQVTRKIADYWTRHPEQQREKKKAFVEALRENGIVRSAAAVAHVDRKIVYSWRLEDAEFRAAWGEALEDATDQVERSLYRQAISEKNVVATIFYLKHNRAKYRDEIRIVTASEVDEAIERAIAQHSLPTVIDTTAIISDTPAPERVLE